MSRAALSMALAALAQIDDGDIYRRHCLFFSSIIRIP
jgi:hypothetical protein